MTYEKKIQVFCESCNTWIDEKKTEFVDIEEGIQGEDILTFICHYCNTKQKSRRYG